MATIIPMPQSEPDALRIVIADCLDIRLTGNRRPGHWGQLASLTKAEYEKALWRFKELGLQDEPRFEVPVTIEYRIRGLRCDADNLVTATKPWTDALVEIGLLRDDRKQWVRRVSAESDSSEGEPQIEIRIRQAWRRGDGGKRHHPFASQGYSRNKSTTPWCDGRMGERRKHVSSEH